MKEEKWQGKDEEWGDCVILKSWRITPCLKRRIKEREREEGIEEDRGGGRGRKKIRNTANSF